MSADNCDICINYFKIIVVNISALLINRIYLLFLHKFIPISTVLYVGSIFFLFHISNNVRWYIYTEIFLLFLHKLIPISITFLYVGSIFFLFLILNMLDDIYAELSEKFHESDIIFITVIDLFYKIQNSNIFSFFSILI